MDEYFMVDSKENIGVYYEKDEYAGFLKRIVIAVIDIVIILLFSAVCLFVSNYFIYSENGYFNFNFFFILFLSILYLAILKRSKYRTVGYILTGVKIVDLKGKQPSIFRMILRVFLLLIGPMELVIDIIWLTSETTRQTLRDKYVGTYVVNQRAVPVGKGKLQRVTVGVMGCNLMCKEVNGSNIK